jgi:hypothetical protein
MYELCSMWGIEGFGEFCMKLKKKASSPW